MRILFAALAVLFALNATEPDAATRNWWHHVEALANDRMQGRDTGSPEYRKAAEYVAAQFERARLKPGGEHGYFQPVPMHRDRLDSARTSLELVDSSGAVQPLQLFRQITSGVRPGLPESFSAGLIFIGPDGNAEGLDTKGKMVVQIGRPRNGGGAQPGAAGVLTIDAAGGPEPPRWPVAYAAIVTLRGAEIGPDPAPLVFRFNPAYAELLFRGSGHSYRELANLRARGKPLPHFAIPLTLRGKLRVNSEDIESDNVLAVLPGSDPLLRDQYVVLSAHLDGYGVGTPFHGDAIYNGAFDDAAYVATLMDLAESWKRAGTKLKRSILFAVVTGEEKGLLGSRYYAQHPTVAKERMVANINLDQLRPIFPLNLLTTLALDESNLGDTVKQVAGSMNIRIQPDPEPARNLLLRSDHINFMRIGVPAVGFIFGYLPGTPEEATYRKWYADRYHSPADDLNQPWDPAAAGKFNTFFARLTETLANAPERPHWKPGSSFAKAN